MVKTITKIINEMILFYSKTEGWSCFGCCSSKSCAQGNGPMMRCFKDKIIKDAKIEPELFLKERRF